MVKEKIMGGLKWGSLVVVAPLAFFGLYAILLLDVLLATLASAATRKKGKSGYESMLDQWELHRDD